VVQEGLTNVLRHASATSASVRLDRHPDRLVVTVEDDGCGSGAGRRTPSTDGLTDGLTEGLAEGLGLRGMRERVHALGGDVSAGPRASGGFAVRAVLPL
jgi:signal transduction histidine kinase